MFIGGAASDVVYYLSDSSSPSTSSTSASASPRSTIPEFGSGALILVASAMVVVSVCAVALTVRKRQQSRQ